MEVFILELAWGEYADADQVMLGVFDSQEAVEKAKADILTKANRNYWPWSALDDKDHVLSYYSVKLNELTCLFNAGLGDKTKGDDELGV
jgi:hypothetical protein